jgi:hypothetical protein
VSECFLATSHLCDLAALLEGTLASSVSLLGSSPLCEDTTIVSFPVGDCLDVFLFVSIVNHAVFNTIGITGCRVFHPCRHCQKVSRSGPTGVLSLRKGRVCRIRSQASMFLPPRINSWSHLVLLPSKRLKNYCKLFPVCPRVHRTT